MTSLDTMQWFACGLSITGAFATAGKARRTRCSGFSLFMISNCILVWWAYSTGNHGILTTQIVFMASSALGMWNNRLMPPPQGEQIRTLETLLKELNTETRT